MKKLNKKDELNDESRSIVECLLSEISREGSKVKRYRNGGLGLENVLTAEVFQMLYLLPRTQFLGCVISQLHAKNRRTIKLLYKEVENVDFNTFPGNYYLIDEPQSHQSGIVVQPDALIVSESAYSLVEVKE